MGGGLFRPRVPLHDQIDLLFHHALRLSSYLLLLVIGSLAAYLAWKFIQRRKFLRSLQMARIAPEELKAKIDRGDAPVVLDLRPEIEFKVEPDTVPGALHFPLEQPERRSKEIPRDR